MTDAILTVFYPPKPLPDGVVIRPADWRADEPAIAAVRRSVFIEEQRVPEDMEWETGDRECDWFVALAGGVVVAVARLTPAGRIGRMAVLPGWRGRGLGSALLGLAVECGRRRGLGRLELHAQCHALGFYERLGFVADGPEFAEADIPHRHMFMNLKEE
ncbi:MAG: GNAT family N-acetyltransferase [Thiobacillus sp.]|nr:GNAT family N-acetyltransferase [Thiobacillus sp.]